MQRIILYHCQTKTKNKKMRKSLLTLVLTMALATGFAQRDTVRLKKMQQESSIITDRAPQAVYFQLGGSGPVFSVNYDRRFSKKVNGLGFAAGIGFFGSSGEAIFSLPLSLNYLIGSNSHFVELAGGATFLTSSSGDLFEAGSGLTIGHVNVGYRYQPTKGGFFFRGGISPLFIGGAYGTSFYLGFGHNF
jgi:hypothetical protein